MRFENRPPLLLLALLMLSFFMRRLLSALKPASSSVCLSVPQTTVFPVFYVSPPFLYDIILLLQVLATVSSGLNITFSSFFCCSAISSGINYIIFFSPNTFIKTTPQYTQPHTPQSPLETDCHLYKQSQVPPQSLLLRKSCCPLHAK